MANCNLILNAPNGNPSVLFTEIMKNSSTIDEAIDVYYYTRTDQFKDYYKSVTKPVYDRNDEPEYSSFSDESYMKNINYSEVQRDDRASVYKRYYKILPNLVETVEDSITRLKSAENLENGSVYLKNMESILESLQGANPRTGLVGLINSAEKHVESLKNRAIEASKKPLSEATNSLAGYKRFADTYTVVGDIRTELAEFAGGDIFGDILSKTDTISANLAFINNLYIGKMEQGLVESIKKVRPDWKGSDIEQSMRETPKDVDSLEHWLEHAEDSHDKLLYSIATLVKSQENRARQAMIETNLEIAKQIEKLYEENPGVNAEKLFDSAIVETETGTLQVVDPRSPRTLQQEHMKNAYDAVMNNKGLKDFLIVFNTLKDRYDAMLPPGKGTGRRLPSVLRNSIMEDMQGKSVQEGVENVFKRTAKGIVRSNTDLERGQLNDKSGKPVRVLPVFFTQENDSTVYKQKLEELSEAAMEGKESLTPKEIEAIEKEAETFANKELSALTSRDLGYVLQSYGAMSVKYAMKKEILNEVEAGLAIAGSKRRKYLIDSGGRKWLNAIKGKPNDTSDQGSKTGEQAAMPKMLQSFLDIHFYGQKELDLGSFSVLGVDFDTNRVLRALNNSTSYITMTAHFRGALANLNTGEIGNIVEAVADEYFGMEDMKEATKAYMRDATSTAKDVANPYKVGFVSLLEQRLDILQQPVMSRKTGEDTAFKRIFSDGSWMFSANAIAEHWIQVRAGMAKLNRTKTYDAAGNEVGNLLKSYNSSHDGDKIGIPADTYIKVKGELVKYDATQELLTIQGIQAMNRRIQGNWAEGSKTAAHQNGWTALLMKYRGYLYPGMVRRFGKGRANYALGDDPIEGFYRTAWREGPQLTKQLTSQLVKFKLDLQATDWETLTPHEQANIRRFAVEAATTVAAISAGTLLTVMAEGLFEDYDDEDMMDNIIMGGYWNSVYLTNRLFTELAGYWNPVEAIRLIRSPAPAISIIENSLNLIKQLGAPAEVYETGSRKGELKIKYDVINLTPVWNQMSSLFSVDDIKTLNNLFTQ